MGEVEARGDGVMQHEFGHDRHTMSLLTDHLVFSPKYRGKVLEGEVAEAAEEIIRETCKELDIEVIDMAVNVDHVHLFIKNPFRKSVYGKMLRSPPKYSVSWIAKRLKGRRKIIVPKIAHTKRMRRISIRRGVVGAFG